MNRIVGRRQPVFKLLFQLRLYLLVPAFANQVVSLAAVLFDIEKLPWRTLLPKALGVFLRRQNAVVGIPVDTG